MSYGMKDSGERENFPSGMVRDTREGKGRYDLISPYALRRLALVYEKGARKYADRNWEKGAPFGRFLDSALRHIQQFLMGMEDEDHLGHAAWNCFAVMHLQDLGRVDLDDRPLDSPAIKELCEVGAVQVIDLDQAAEGLRKMIEAAEQIELQPIPHSISPSYTVYIAGPMAGIHNFNKEAFIHVAEELRGMGWGVVSPQEVDDEGSHAPGFDPNRPGQTVTPTERAWYLKRDFKLLLGCDGIVMLPGWKNSTGAKAELLTAQMAGMDVWQMEMMEGGACVLSSYHDPSFQLASVLRHCRDVAQAKEK